MCFSSCCYKQLGDCMQVVCASVFPPLKLCRTECALLREIHSLGIFLQLSASGLCWWVMCPGSCWGQVPLQGNLLGMGWRQAGEAVVTTALQAVSLSWEEHGQFKPGSVLVRSGGLVCCA